jgi:hypothetical protein
MRQMLAVVDWLVRDQSVRSPLVLVPSHQRYVAEKLVRLLV